MNIIRLISLLGAGFIAFWGWTSLVHGKWTGVNGYGQTVWSAGAIGVGVLLCVLVLIPGKWVERLVSRQLKSGKSHFENHPRRNR